MPSRRSRRAPVVRALAFTSAVSCLGALVLAQDAPVVRWSGSFGVAYAVALTDPAGAPAVGPLLRADLALEDGPRRTTLAVDPLGLRRSGLTLEVREGAELLSVRWTQAPEAVGAVRNDVQALVVARPDGAPTVQAVLASQRSSAAGGSGSLLARLALSDRAVRPAPGVGSFDWRASLQSVAVDVAATGVRRATTTAAFSVGAAFGGADERRFRPALGASVDLLGGDRSGRRLGVDVGLAFDATATEAVDLRGDARWDTDRPGVATRTSLALRSDRFAPLGLVADVERSAATATAAWRWSVGADARLAGGWTLAGGYRGEADDAGSGHGVDARVALRRGTGGRSLSAGVEGGLLWRSDGTLRPDLGGTLAASWRDGGPWSGTVGASLRYADRWAAALDGSLRAEFDAASLDADLAVALADTWSADAGVRLAVAAWDPVDVQVGLEGRFGPDPAALALDVGLRYRLGGPR